MKLLQRFFNSDASGGIVLIIAAALAMLCANLGVTQDLYRSFLQTPVELTVGSLEIKKRHAAVDQRCVDGGLFLMVGLGSEIRAG